MKTRLYIAFGANLGSPEETYRDALTILEDKLGFLVAHSPLYTSQALSKPNQIDPGLPTYRNSVAAFTTELSAREILKVLQEVEQRFGRDRSQEEEWNSRVIDLDLLSLGDLCLEAEDLTVPHPRMSERDFVLYPLKEISPDYIHPVSRKSIATLIQEFEESKLPKTLVR